MKKLSEYLFLWTFGGCLYYSFEVIFRGFSHWSMFILGGICFVFFAIQGKMVHWQDALWRQLLRSISGLGWRYGITAISPSSSSGRYACHLWLYFPACAFLGSC